ncbi:hypothetical protein [Paenibacillus sp. MBLB4367]|uniref:hypothetical protein n=1 Tax=Paenibacillus sp. MBLB4367 TaxID=3384767 RepID=UPI003908068F
MRSYTKWFIRVAAVYLMIGVFIGSDMAGRKDYSIIPVHSHILVLGWLSMFAFGIFYYLFTPGMLKLSKLQAWTSLLGGTTMPIGFLLYIKAENAATLGVFIGTASLLLIGVVLFVLITLFDKKVFGPKETGQQLQDPKTATF